MAGPVGGLRLRAAALLPLLQLRSCGHVQPHEALSGKVLGGRPVGPRATVGGPMATWCSQASAAWCNHVWLPAWQHRH